MKLLCIKSPCVLHVYLETAAEGRRSLNKVIKNWYKKRSKIVHGDGNKVVEWQEIIEKLSEVVRQAGMTVWQVKRKGNFQLNEYLFLGDHYQRTL